MENFSQYFYKFSGGRFVKVEAGSNAGDPNCEEDACGEYYVMNGYSGDALSSTSSFATLAVKKNAGTVMGYGNSNPEIKGEGVVRVLFWSGNKGELSKDCVDSKDWSDGNKCKGTWKMTKDESKNGGRKRTGKGWYIIGFIWDEKTQYFGFIKETSLWKNVLRDQNNNLTIDLSQGRDKWNGLFNEKFTNLLDEPVNNVGCLHLSNSNTGSLNGRCGRWSNWKEVITIPMGYVGSKNGSFEGKKLRDAALVVPANYKNSKLQTIALTL